MQNSWWLVYAYIATTTTLLLLRYSATPSPEPSLLNYFSLVQLPGDSPQGRETPSLPPSSPLPTIYLYTV